jgi:tetratricopeptide (TPR) repeat protein
MGVVYKARHRQLGRLVALKTILAGAHAGAAGLARFRIEAEAVARLQHPNVVQIHEVGSHHGLPFFSLEYCPGGSLGDQLDGTPWSPPRAAEMVATLARAVEAAHRAGVVHRDLKPANVLVAEDGTPKVSDFGLAKKTGESGNTATGAILGTPSYMAPEQAAGNAKYVGPAADVYALGAILYELLTGRPPFKAATSLDTLLQVVADDPVPPSRLQPGVPSDLDTACLKCLEKDPVRRYASAQALAEDLTRFLQHEPILARPIGRIERVLKWARRRPALASLVVVLVAAASGVLGLMVWHYADLQLRVEQAVLSEKAARQEADQATRSAALERLIARGQAALAQDTPDGLNQAASVLAEALDRGEQDGSSDNTVVEARQLLARLRARVAEQQEQQAARQHAQENWSAFRRLRDQALLHATLSIGDDLPANLQRAVENARAALARFGVSADGDGRPALDAALTLAEKGQVHEDCYLLLVVWAEAENELQHTPAALALLRRADGLQMPTRAWHLRRGRYLRQLGREADAKEEERGAERVIPTLAVDYYLMGDERYKQGNLEGAVRDFENVLLVKAGDFWARYFLSACFVRLNRPDQAQAFLTDCISQQPGFVWLYLMRGFASGQRDQFNAAEEDFAKAEQLLKAQPDDEARYALYTNRGVLRARQDRRIADAIADLKQAIAIRPQRYQAYLTLGQIYQTQKEWNTALAYFNQGIERDPASAFLYRNRAQFYLERQDPDAALGDYEHAIAAETLAGARTDAHDLARDQAQRGRILYQGGRSEEAVKAFGEAVKAWPGYTKAYLYRAEVELRLERYQAAIASLEQYKMHGGVAQVEVYQARAQALTRLGHYRDAVQAYSLAVELRPKDSGLYAARGWLQLAAHAAEPALHDFERAVELDPKNGDACNGRGQAQASLGRYREAVADAHTALRLGPETPKLLADAARTFALAVGQLDAERAKLPPLAKRAQVEAVLRLRAEYLQQTLALLCRALNASRSDAERTRLWRERVLGDAALEVVHGSVEFGRLRAEYGAK